MEANGDLLTKVAYDCAHEINLWGKEGAQDCFRRNMGFTYDCSDCWAQAAECTYQNCYYLCQWHFFWETPYVDEVSGKLNDCMRCNENLCGADFVRCAGANRRRAGYASDIDRSMTKEVCKTVDSDWQQCTNGKCIKATQEERF